MGTIAARKARKYCAMLLMLLVLSFYVQPRPMIFISLAGWAGRMKKPIVCAGACPALERSRAIS